MALSRRTRLALTVVLAAALAAWLGLRAAAQLDPARHARQAAAVLHAPDRITHRLPPERPPSAGGVTGSFAFRRAGWLSVVSLDGLAPVAGRDRYLVFLHNRDQWVLAGAVGADARGHAQVRFGAEPRPRTVYEVVVTRGVDDASNVPHGTPLLHWMDPRAIAAGAKRYDFTNVVEP